MTLERENPTCQHLLACLYVRTWKLRAGPADMSTNLVFSKWNQWSLEREGAMWHTASAQQVPQSQVRLCVGNAAP